MNSKAPPSFDPSDMFGQEGLDKMFIKGDFDVVMEREFTQKRNKVFSEMMRKMSLECGRRCIEYQTGAINFSNEEEVCINRCVSKMAGMRDLLEKHIQEVETPAFFAQFLP